MKYIEFYKTVLNCKNNDEVFEFLISNLKPSIFQWSYFVNWEKVFKNTNNIEIALNNLNYLIGKDNFDEAFRDLIKHNPTVAKVIPALAVRDGENSMKFKILVDFKSKRLIYEYFDFNKDNPSDEDVEKYLLFIKQTGLKQLITSKKIKNLVDYMLGVEAGLDSNGRKNRSGSCMENIVEEFLKDYCKRNSYEYIKGANSKKIEEKWGYNVPVDKSSRIYDFVINKGKELLIFETNFYSGGGSKLKSTAGEYRNLFDVIAGKYKFIWITDGMGWESTSRPLRETFDHNEYLFNLTMIEKGVLGHL